MKSFPFIACLVIGLWVGFFFGKNKPVEVAVEERKQSEPTRSVEDNASGEIASLNERIIFLEKELAVFQSEQASRDLEEKKAKEKLNAREQAAKEKVIARRLQEFRGLFELTPEQAARIGELAWESSNYWKKVHAGEIDIKKQPWIDVDAEIKALLTPDQLEIFEVHLEERKESMASLAATSTLASYPVTLLLSEEQKDSIFANLYSYHRSNQQDGIREAVKNTMPEDYKGMDQALIWAAKDILEEEQYLALLQSLKKE